MQLNIPHDLLQGQPMSEKELLLDLALGLYIDRRVTLGQAARLAGCSSPAFLDELGKRKIPVHYDEQDLESDARTLQVLREKRDHAAS